MTSQNLQLPGLSAEETRKFVPQNTIILGYMGSISHGTYVPKSDPNSIDDRDILGVCIAPKNIYIGLGHFEQLEKKDGEYDSVVYEIRKYFRLLLKQNPNVMGLLWLDKANYINVTEHGKRIIEHREIFSSKQAYHSFAGYAHEQLRRMTHFKFQGYMGEKRKALVNQFGYDCKN
ncbi:MAG: nucleotidyltransferase domain-containing protein, partial [Candidatus Edwardsbacteria bacterium]|nr:nucleotidyltransferase domain-containing protein [Candidatus Edwardsbacteria bacterium]